MTSPTAPDQLLLRRALPTLRVELADAATRGRVATPADVAAVIAGSDPVDAGRAADRAADREGALSAVSLIDPAGLTGDAAELAADALWVDAVLDALTEACAQRGEPNLASLVVRDAGHSAEHLDAERRRCWRHWGGQAAESAGLALALR